MVAEEGNRRVGSMGAADVRQCVLDIVGWFGSRLIEQDGVDSALIESLQKSVGRELPQGLVLLLKECGRGIWFYERRGMNGEEILKMTTGSGIPDNIIPFASDCDGNLYVIDSTRRDAIFEWDSEGRGTQISTSFDDFIEKLRDDLLSNRYEFIEDVGVVEGLANTRCEGKSVGGK